jgi:hypothetical protein
LSRSTLASTLTLDYLAGASFSNDQRQGTSGIQSLDFSDTIHHGRWSFMVGDQFTYLSESPFGFGGLGGLNGYGVPLGNGGVGAGSGLDGQSPNQSILVNGARASNAVLGQGDYGLTHRSSLTIGVNYGFLDYFTGGFSNDSSVTVTAGYNYQMNRKDSLSISYLYDRFMFSQSNLDFSSHVIKFGYARRVTNRVSFQIAAGPQIQLFNAALQGPQTLVGWTLSSSAVYSRGSFGADVDYVHALTGGSGIFFGAETHTVSGTLNKTYSHDWNSSVGFGYSMNKALQQTNVNADSIAPQSWFFFARLNRRIFANSSLFFSYQLTEQSALTGACTPPACRSTATSQMGSIGYTWGLRRIILD